MKRIQLLLLLVMGPWILMSQPSWRDSVDVSLPLEGGSLQGTLFTPLGIKKPPVVLIIAGSGPTDRNGNSPMVAGKNNSLLQLADSLASHGIASLRYDKRGIAKSQVKGLKEENMCFGDGVNDAIAWIQWLKSKGYKKIYIAGHSEGSLVGMAAANLEKLSGFVSLAGSGRRIDIVLREQLQAGTGPDSLKQLAGRYLDTLLSGARLAKPSPLLFSLFRPSVQPYMISWLQYDPYSLMASLSCKTLIVQGKKDIQINETDARLLHEANPKSLLVLVDDMNHVFKAVKTDSRVDNLKAYSDASLPVMGELVQAMVKFIN
jgi:pimeloyl-ACP methyl ester carboxylesterase